MDLPFLINLTTIYPQKCPEELPLEDDIKKLRGYWITEINGLCDKFEDNLDTGSVNVWHTQPVTMHGEWKRLHH